MPLNYSNATEPYHIWVPRDPLGGIPWGGIPWGDRWDLGTDGTLGPMGPGPQGPPFGIFEYGGLFNAPVRRKFRIPVPDPRLPGPGAGYPAAGPGAGCRLPGRPFFETKKSVLRNFRVTEFPCNGIVVCLSPCVLFVSEALPIKNRPLNKGAPHASLAAGCRPADPRP